MSWEFAQLHQYSREVGGRWFAGALWYPPDGSIVTLVAESPSDDFTFDPVVMVNHYGNLGWELFHIEITNRPWPTEAAFLDDTGLYSRRWWFKRGASGRWQYLHVDIDSLMEILWALQQGENLTSERIAKAASNDFALLAQCRNEAMARRENGNFNQYTSIAHALTAAIAYAIDLQ